MPSGHLHQFRIRRGWRAGGLVTLGEVPPASEMTVEVARPWTGNHRIDLRASIPLPTGRWYVTIVAGPERRSADRLRSEGQTHWLRRGVVYIMLMSLGLWMAACVIAVVYLLKSALGVDVFEGNSPLHFLWEWMFESAAAATPVKPS